MAPGPPPVSTVRPAAVRAAPELCRRPVGLVGPQQGMPAHDADHRRGSMSAVASLSASLIAWSCSVLASSPDSVLAAADRAQA